MFLPFSPSVLFIFGASLAMYDALAERKLRNYAFISPRAQETYHCASAQWGECCPIWGRFNNFAISAGSPQCGHQVDSRLGYISKGSNGTYIVRDYDTPERYLKYESTQCLSLWLLVCVCVRGLCRWCAFPTEVGWLYINSRVFHPTSLSQQRWKAYVFSFANHGSLFPILQFAPCTCANVSVYSSFEIIDIVFI